jgi:glycosyltransferase involved in cell wall biosynthesis
MDLVFFNWPSALGGADTKVVHLLPMLADGYNITLVPNNSQRLKEPQWKAWSADHGFRTCEAKDLPRKMSGWGIGICNDQMFAGGLAGLARKRGLRTAWSNEMMWHFEAECAAITLGQIDTLLYISPVQRTALEPAYLQFMHNKGEGPQRPAKMKHGQESGWIDRRDGGPPVRWVMTGHYVDPSLFPFRGPRARRSLDPLVIGRLSRPDPTKFPDDFPAFYENLGLRRPVKFRVMGWDNGVAAAWPDHVFDDRWELLPPMAESSDAFLRSLDILVYSLGPRFRESWGRVIVEAMLTGVVPLVPRGGGHHLENLVPHGVGGFLCDGPEDFGKYARMLQDDAELLARLSHGAREWAVTRLCDRREHRRLWDMVFQG